MISPFTNTIRKLEYFQDNHKEIVIDSAMNFEDEILQMNTDDQLHRGIEATGKPITPKYTPYTISLKKIKGQPTNRVTLLDEGNFYADFFIHRQLESFIVSSKDEKAAALRKKYGDEIYGLTDDSLQKLIDLARENINNKFRKFVLG